MRRTLVRAVWVAVAIAAPALAAQERSLHIESFDAAITVRPDSRIDVTETITARFVGSWNGIYRTIPVKYRTPQGFNWTLDLDDLSATDADGQPLRIERSRERHYAKVKIWVPGATDAKRTLVLRYTASNGLRYFEDHDELYWNITGDEWDVPIEAASARIELPPAATGLRAVAFNGPYGSTASDASVESAATSVRIAMPGGLGFREGLTAVVGWDKGVVTEPTATDRAAGFVASNWPLAIPIPVFFAMFAVWRRRGRDPRQLPIAVQYEPPTGLTPAEAGTLVDNSADLRDITATLVDLAVRGHLRIEEEEKSQLFGLLKGQEYVFRRLTPPGRWYNNMKAHERSVLQGVFGLADTRVPLSDLENEFYQKLSGIKTDIFEALIAAGCYRSRPDSVQGMWIGIGVGAGALVGVGGAIISRLLLLTPVPFIVAGILTGLIIVGFGIFMPARTVAGVRMLEQVLGFGEFLERVEGDRIRDFVKTPEMFERYLPFAMALGVEKKWAAAFSDIYTEPPTWYHGNYPGRFNVGHFSSRLSALSTTAGSTMSSSPRTSSGSGFSGGGSSGGGGGGGGGGGF